MVIWCCVRHVCLVDDLVDFTYPQPFATGPAWISIGVARGPVMDLVGSVLHDAKQGQRGHENEHAEQRDGQQAHWVQQPGGILMQ
jgi:hypothetical protein